MKTGTKQDLPPESEDTVFLLAHSYEIDPVFSRNFLAELKKTRRFSFRGKNNKEAAPGYTFGFVIAQTIKQLLQNQTNPTTAIGLYMNSITGERQREPESVFS